MRTRLDVPFRQRAWRVIPAFVVALGALALPVRKAAAQINDTHVPVSMVLINGCTGEPLAGSGFLHLRFNTTTTPNFHISVEENLESFQATTPLGVKYVVPFETSAHEIFDEDFMPTNENVEQMLQFVRQGEDGTFIAGDDFYSRFRFHFTINANGILTVNDLEFAETCH